MDGKTRGFIVVGAIILAIVSFQIYLKFEKLEKNSIQNADTIRTLRFENDRFSRTIEEFKLSNDKLSTRVYELNFENMNLYTRVNNIKAENSKLITKIKELEENKSNLESEINRLTNLTKESNLRICNASVHKVFAAVAYPVGLRQLNISAYYPILPGDCYSKTVYTSGVEKNFYVFGVGHATAEWILVNDTINNIIETKYSWKEASKYTKYFRPFESIYYGLTDDLQVCLDPEKISRRMISFTDRSKCTEGQVLTSFTQAALLPKSYKTRRNWVHVFEQNNFPMYERTPDDPTIGLEGGLRRARELAQSAESQLKAIEYLGPRTLTAQLGAHISDANSHLVQGIDIDRVAPLDIYKDEQKIRNGDLIIAINGHKIYSIPEFEHQLHIHATDLNSGIEKPLVLTVVRASCPSGCDVKARYFFNRYALSQIDNTDAAYYGVLDAVFLGQAPLVNCIGDNALSFLGNVLSGALELGFSIAEERRFKNRMLRVFDYRDIQQCRWGAEQQRAMAQQLNSKLYTDIGWVGMATPGALRLVIGKVARRKAAKALGRGALARGITEGALEAGESALWALGTAAPGTPTVERLKTAAGVAPIAGGLGLGVTMMSRVFQ